MPGNPREIITMAERCFPVRIRIGAPPGGFGLRHAEMTAWLDENCGADGWAITPSGVRGVLNDAVSIYFLDAMLASAFVARWCAPPDAADEELLRRCAGPVLDVETDEQPNLVQVRRDDGGPREKDRPVGVQLRLPAAFDRGHLCDRHRDWR